MTRSEYTDSNSKVNWQTYTGWPFDSAEAKRRQAETASSLGVPVTRSIQIHGTVQLDLMLIPSGDFSAGSPETERERRNDEQQHVVRITRPFYIGKYPVTQAQWEQVVGSDDNPSGHKGPNRPVEKVRWDDIQEKLLPTIQIHASDGEVFRLPTEAEWEYACRAGTQTPYSNGDSLSKADACFSTGLLSSLAGMFTGTGTKPVGSYAPNPWGIYDMHGNVWEWCQDYYNAGFYKASQANDPCNTQEEKDRVVRGGGYAYYGPGSGRSAHRRAFPGIIPGDKCDDLGFRVVLSI